MKFGALHQRLLVARRAAPISQHLVRVRRVRAVESPANPAVLTVVRAVLALRPRGVAARAVRRLVLNEAAEQERAQHEARAQIEADGLKVIGGRVSPHLGRERQQPVVHAALGMGSQVEEEAHVQQPDAGQQPRKRVERTHVRRQRAVRRDVKGEGGGALQTGEHDEHVAEECVRVLDDRRVVVHVGQQQQAERRPQRGLDGVSLTADAPRARGGGRASGCIGETPVVLAAGAEREQHAQR
eukprot:7292457-Prymnesium_polylepis.1